MADEGARHPIDVHVGTRLRVIRRAAKISQTALARTAGVTFQQVQKYERGANRISASKLFEFAQALGVSPMAFYAGLAESAADEAESDAIAVAGLDPQTVRLARQLDAVRDPVARAHLGKLIERLSDRQTV